MFRKLLLGFFIGILNVDYGMADDPVGMLYENEDKSGISLNYFEDTLDYGRIQAVVDGRNMSGLASFCATGVFVLYNHEEFDSDADEDIRILAGKDTCVPPGSVKSLLFVQSYGSTVQNTVTMFTTERFGGDLPLIITNRTQHDNVALMTLGQVGSFILMGASGWTVITRYRTFCMKAGEPSEFPICPVPYPETLVRPEELNWLSIREGCNETDGSIKVISLPYCFNHGSGNLEPISLAHDNETSTTSPNATESSEQLELEGWAGATRLFSKCPDDSFNYTEVAVLLRVRVTHDFESVYQVQFPFNKAHSWRTEILDYIMEIVEACTLDELIDKQVLRYVREWYVYFAEKLVWNGDTQNKPWPTEPKQRVLQMAHEVGRCLTHMTDKGWVNVGLLMSSEILKKVDPSSGTIQPQHIDPKFKPVSKLNIVMEYVWLSINFVGRACHQALGYHTDFWMDYTNIVLEMYLRPMNTFWQSPKVIQDYWDLLLGGFGNTRQLNNLAALVTLLHKRQQEGGAEKIGLLTRP